MACTSTRTPCQEALRARVRGQEAAVRLVAAAVARARVQLQAILTATLRARIGAPNTRQKDNLRGGASNLRG